MKTLRMKLAFLLLPEIEKLRISDAIRVYDSVRNYFGLRGVRELLRPDRIAEIHIVREVESAEMIH